MMVPAERPELPALVLAMSERIAAARRRSLAAVSREMVLLYWELGRHIVEFEQGGETRAQYGEALLPALGAALTQAHGPGFSVRNLANFRAFYRAFPDFADASAKLTWSHFVRVLRVESEGSPDDNPPVGILLCMDRNELYVKYATTGMENLVLAGRFALQLPDPEQLSEAVAEVLREVNDAPEGRRA
jgi:DUF1016 N-terminal domain/YhcG PDDEXK nuclease domain